MMPPLNVPREYVHLDVPSRHPSIQSVIVRMPQSFVAALRRIRLSSVFNPYADRCPEYDRYDAARIRRQPRALLGRLALHARRNHVDRARPGLPQLSSTPLLAMESHICH